MKRVLIAALLALACLPNARAADRYSLTDKGGFGYTGRHVELSSRFGWASYEAKFEFGLDMGAHSLTRDSVLKLKITRNDGSSWSTKCKAKKDRQMWANINALYGKGVSVLAECRIPPGEFAKLVDLDEGLVGEPTFVFQAMVRDGEAQPGLQKGFYFLAAAEIASGELAPFATMESDPAALGVLFSSAMAPYALHPTYAMAPRYLP